MTIKQYFSCPECRRPCRWDPQLAGRHVLCGRCRSKIRVPNQLTADVEVHPPAQNANWDWNDDDDSADFDVTSDTGTYQFLDTSLSPAAPLPQPEQAPQPKQAPQPAATSFPMPTVPYPPHSPAGYPQPGNSYPAPPPYPPVPAYSGQPPYGPPGYPPPYPPSYPPPPHSGYPAPPPYAYAPTAPPYAQTAPGSARRPPRPSRRTSYPRDRSPSGGSFTIVIVVVMGLLGAAGAMALAYNVIIPFQKEQARLKALEASLQAPDFNFNAVEPTHRRGAATAPSISALPELTSRYPAAWPELFKRQTAAMETGLTSTIRKSILALPAHIAESKRVQGRWSKGDVAASWTINGYNVDMTLLGPDKKAGTGAIPFGTRFAHQD